MSIFGSEVALLIIDMVNDFVSEDGAMYVSGAEEIIPAIKQMADEARSLESPVIYICDSHDVPDAESGTWPRYTENGTPGIEIVPQLRPAPSDFIVRKHQYSAPFSTDLDLLLKELGVAKLVLTGTAVDVRIYFIAQDAHKKGYQIVVPRECVVALSEGDRDASLKQMEQLFDTEII
ncbi:cysteine hydrolase family protein [Candidatus Poribacteria bacterium]